MPFECKVVYKGSMLVTGKKVASVRDAETEAEWIAADRGIRDRYLNPSINVTDSWETECKETTVEEYQIHIGAV